MENMLAYWHVGVLAHALIRSLSKRCTLVWWPRSMDLSSTKGDSILLSSSMDYLLFWNFIIATTYHLGQCMDHFSRRWTTIPAPSVSYSVHQGKHFFDLAVSGLFLKLILPWGRYGCSYPAALLMQTFISLGTKELRDDFIFRFDVLMQPLPTPVSYYCFCVLIYSSHHYSLVDVIS